MDAAQLPLLPDAEHDPGCRRSISIPTGVLVDAKFGGDRQQYRYKLIQRWSAGPMVLFILMNPSAASTFSSDMTVEKCGRFARRWGFGGQFVANTCAYRATDRMRLLEVEDPVGPRNLEAISEMAEESEWIVVAHGKLPGRLQRHADAIVDLLLRAGRVLSVLRLSSDGVPVHPLARGKAFVPMDCEPMVWKVPA